MAEDKVSKIELTEIAKTITREEFLAGSLKRNCPREYALKNVSHLCTKIPGAGMSSGDIIPKCKKCWEATLSENADIKFKDEEEEE